MRLTAKRVQGDSLFGCYEDDCPNKDLIPVYEDGEYTEEDLTCPTCGSRRDVVTEGLPNGRMRIAEERAE